MSATADLLVEIGTEELPPKALPALSAAFHAGVERGLTEAELAHGAVTPYAAPRRLALWVRDVPLRQADRTVERRGPALAAAFDEDGCPTKAAQGFARSCGVAVEDLEKLETDKGAWLVHRTLETGRPAAALIPDIVRGALKDLPVPRVMRWGAGEAEFVRPVHWVVLLLGDEVVDAEILGIRAGRETRGHRFHHPAPLSLSEPAAYAPLLETEGRVIADFAARREAIRGQAEDAAHALGGRAFITGALLDEVAALVEWPVALTGDFDPAFLEVPAAALMSSMMQHQKCFPVTEPAVADGAAGRLKPHFIAVSNLESRDPAQVKAGNERVIRPRLADARFFWEQDRKLPLGERIETLKTVVFQEKLGTLHDKAARVSRLAAGIAQAMGIDTALAERAGWLAKCDLMTEMVGEFPELQGTMGEHYAAVHEDPAVARAVGEQYMPAGGGAAIPATPTGRALALADRLDTVTGIFAVGQAPTGAKDPFALRRAALGVVRILIEGELDLDLADLFADAAALVTDSGVAADATLREQVLEFTLERLRAYYRDQGLPTDSFNAVLAERPTRPLDFDRRIRALTAFRALPESEALAAANKRIANILRKAAEAGEDVPASVATRYLREPAERALYEAVDLLADEVGPLFERGEYAAALRRLASLREPVDRFFDDVMVMAEDADLRANRLALLRDLQQLFLRVADLSRLQGK